MLRALSTNHINEPRLLADNEDLCDGGLSMPNGVSWAIILIGSIVTGLPVATAYWKRTASFGPSQVRSTIALVVSAATSLAAMTKTFRQLQECSFGSDQTMATKLILVTASFDVAIQVAYVFILSCFVYNHLKENGESLEQVENALKDQGTNNPGFFIPYMLIFCCDITFSFVGVLSEVMVDMDAYPFWLILLSTLGCMSVGMVAGVVVWLNDSCCHSCGGGSFVGMELISGFFIASLPKLLLGIPSKNSVLILLGVSWLVRLLNKTIAICEE